MTLHSDRVGGRVVIAIGIFLAFAILMGAGFETGFIGQPDDRVFVAMSVVLGVTTVVSIGVGAYNLGRERGR